VRQNRNGKEHVMALFGETIETPRDLYLHKLGAALTMEKTILDMLPQLEEHAQDEQLKSSLRQHRAQTERHVQNLERTFQALGAEVDDSPCPAIEGLEKEGQANLKMVADNLNDAVILAGVCETEHHEIAVYDGLITTATAMGEDDVAALLQENLEQEEATLETARQLSQQLAQRTAQVI
jgi:ferritin-like metal-binding protein YciE